MRQRITTKTNLLIYFWCIPIPHVQDTGSIAQEPWQPQSNEVRCEEPHYVQHMHYDLLHKHHPGLISILPPSFI